MQNGENPTAQERLSATADHAAAHRAQAYLLYLVRIFRATTPYALYLRARAVFRPTLFVARLFRVVARLFAFLETTALFVVVFAFLLILTPAALLLLLLFTGATVIVRRKFLRRHAVALRGRVLVFFPLGYTPFLEQTYADLAAHYTVLVVTDRIGDYQSAPRPHPLAPAVCRPDGVILLRGHTYFSFRPYLRHHAASLALIY